MISCSKEQELLEKWASFVRECDPDLITGYNINNFDLPYLLNRAKALKVPNFNYLGRIKDVQSVVKESVLQSKQMGRRENKNVNMEGRCAFDLLLILVFPTPALLIVQLFRILRAHCEGAGLQVEIVHSKCSFLPLSWGTEGGCSSLSDFRSAGLSLALKSFD